MAVKYKSISAAKKAGSIYYYDKNGTKQLAVTRETLDAWKKKNKGKYKGNALTAWANNKGKNVGAPKKKEEIQVRKLSPSTVGRGRGDGEMELFQRKVDKRKAKPGGSAVSPRAGVGGGTFAGKGAGKDKPKAKSKQRAPVPDIYMDTNQKDYKFGDVVLPKDRGKNTKGDAQDNNPNKKLAGAGNVPKDSGNATRNDGPNLAPKRTGSKDKTSAARNSAARVKAKDNVARGDVATNSPATATNQDPNQNKTGRLSPRLLELQRKRLERQAAKKAANMNKGGMTKGYNEGGLRMVKKGDEEVPFFAADGKGKMNKGGMTKKSGYMGGGMTKKKVMTYNMGGMVKSQTNNLKKGRS